MKGSVGLRALRILLVGAVAVQRRPGLPAGERYFIRRAGCKGLPSLGLFQLPIALSLDSDL